MTTNEKSRPLVAQETGQDEIVAFDGAAFSKSNFSTNSGETQSIFDLLPQGEDHAISSRQLAELAGASSVRDLQSRISVEREGGALILSTCRNGGGYFRPSPGEDGKKEIVRYITTLRSRAVNTFRAFRGAKAAIAADTELSGQIDLDELTAMLQ